MMSRSFSDRLELRNQTCAAALAFLLTLPPAAFGHPELLLQIEVLDQQLQQQPGDGLLLLQRADLYRRHGDYAAAERDLLTAGQSDPVPAELAFFQGRLQLDSGQAAAAESSFSRYLASHPAHVKALILRAEARLALGQAELAAADYGLAIEMAESPSPGLYRQHALTLVAAGAPRWPAALAVIDSGLARFPSDVSLLGLGADIALARGDTNIAAAYFNQLPRSALTLPQWKSRMALAATLQSADPAVREAGLQMARERLLSQAPDQAAG